MMIDGWIPQLTEKLKTAFGDKLLFVGLQGSYRRGEANADSDIDAVVILDALSLSDLKQYKDILGTMPESEKACGFIGGKQALQNWPRHELFQFAQDTRACYGTLDGLLPPMGPADVIVGVRVGASGLYHACCHTYLHGEPQALKGLYKAAFFVLQALYYLRHDEYIGTQKELRRRLTGVEKDMLRIGMDWPAYQDGILAQPEGYFDALIGWCADVLNEISDGRDSHDEAKFTHK